MAYHVVLATAYMFAAGALAGLSFGAIYDTHYDLPIIYTIGACGVGSEACHHMREFKQHYSELKDAKRIQKLMQMKRSEKQK